MTLLKLPAKKLCNPIYGYQISFSRNTHHLSSLYTSSMCIFSLEVKSAFQIESNHWSRVPDFV